MTGVYVVDVPDTADESGYGVRGTVPGRATATRFIIIAATATEAETIALLAAVAAPLRDDESFIARVEVGRLGNYDPGIGGARMASGSAIIALGTISKGGKA